MVLEEHKKKHLKIVNDIHVSNCFDLDNRVRSLILLLLFQNSEGRVSTTTDMWSDPNRDSYMAVTAHFMMQNEHGHLELMSHLIAFRFVEGNHSGVNLGQHFVKIIEENAFLHKVMFFWSLVKLHLSSKCIYRWVKLQWTTQKTIIQ